MGVGTKGWYERIPIAEFLREQFVFIGLLWTVGDRGVVLKFLEGNEPPEVISFDFFFFLHHYPSRENSYFFYVMLIPFSVVVVVVEGSNARIFIRIRSAKR